MAHNGLHILLVEDNPGDVDLVREALESVRALTDLAVAADGEQALAYLRGAGRFADRIMPDLVILDLNLPKVDGREVLRAMRSSPALECTPVVVLTSSGAHSDVERAYALKANCYVVKPGDLDAFIRTVKEIQHFWCETVKLPPPESRVP